MAVKGDDCEQARLPTSGLAVQALSDWRMPAAVRAAIDEFTNITSA